MSFSASRLLALLPSITRRQCTGSLRAFISELEVDPNLGLLVQIQVLLEALEKSGFLLVPPWTEGDADSERTIVLATDFSDPTEDAVRRLIKEGENSRAEFKSTFFVDLKKMQATPNLPPNEYKSVDVIQSALKTIAAMMNSDGGDLLVGVADDGTPIGLNPDHKLPAMSNEDKWQLSVRSAIETGFKDGKAVNSYVKVSICTYEEKFRIALFKIVPRQTTTYVKSPSGEFLLYTRNGNRTDKLDTPQAEDYFRMKWGISP